MLASLFLSPCIGLLTSLELYLDVDPRVAWGMNFFWIFFLLTSWYYAIMDDDPAAVVYHSTAISMRSRVSRADYRKVKPVIMKNMGVSFFAGHALFRVTPPFWDVCIDPHSSWSLWEWAAGFGLTFLVLELVFYFVHRAFHAGGYTRSYHQQHHEYDTPFALTALYCSWVEMVCQNMASVLLGPWLLQMPIVPFCLWMSIVGVDIAVGHSGHRWISFHDTDFHDNHHKTRNKNFGVSGVLDTLLHTNTKKVHANT